MKAGQKSMGNNGLQNALFPMDCLYITQGSGGSYSHTGTYAIDCVGWNGSSQVPRYPYYAPFDCTCISVNVGQAYVVWQSDNEVNYPTGRGKLSIVCIHDNDVGNNKVGDKKKQGQFLGRTGTAGNVTGDHAHFEMFFAGKEWQRPSGMIELFDSVFIDGTEIYNDFGYNWRESGDPIIDIEPICKNDYLTLPEMTNNAQYIAYYLINDGWTANAIAGMLGNMQTESTINPCIWQNLISYDSTPYIEVEGHGYGLVQWTPFNKYTIWARDNHPPYNSMDSQLERINYEVANGIQWIVTSEFPFSFEEFKTSTQTPEYLAKAFLRNYERPRDGNQPIRETQARYWFDTLDWSGQWNGGDGEKQENKIIEMLLADALNGWKF